MCGASFAGGTFFDDGGQPLCETHYHERRGSLCHECRQPISGRCVTAIGRKFHPEHFRCSYCNRQLTKGTFKEVDRRKKGRDQATVIGALEPLVTPTCLTHTALSTNRPCIMGLTPFEFKQVGVASRPGCANQSRLATPPFPHDDTHANIFVNSSTQSS
ncbi:hypothetical protein Y032_0436g1442 [Ancylostoma ceylanicum]|uniref:LIM zinc-binding domain-containing protein n=1 Tax=Ancylostoma ceylanicum TaxID=53326 RepID=A0A016X104_9BILA|nr:hypothetical protein Y032_0436g1442 [Ancylostoma ceylanicum]